MNKFKLPYEKEFKDRLEDPTIPHNLMEIINSKVSQKLTPSEFCTVRDMTYHLCLVEGINMYNDLNKVFYSEMVNYSVIKKWTKNYE